MVRFGSSISSSRSRRVHRLHLAYRTFYERASGGLPAVQEGVAHAVTQCVETGLIVHEGGRLCPTQLGKVFASAGVSLATSTRLAALLELFGQAPPSRQDIAFEIATTTVSSCSSPGGSLALAAHARRGTVATSGKPSTKER
jgi:hypothetical protein